VRKNTLILFLVITSLIKISYSQNLLLEDSFNYPAGNLLTSHGWSAHSGAGNNPIKVHNEGLVYPGYASMGQSAIINNNGEDVHRTFTNQTSGTVYFSFLFKIISPVDGFFIHLARNNTDFSARVFVQNSSGDIKLSLSNSNTVAANGSTTITLNTTYLCIVKYNVSSIGECSLWVFQNALPLSEEEAGTPEIITEGSGQPHISRIALRQYHGSQNYIVDEIRVANSWPIYSNKKIFISSTRKAAAADIYPNATWKLPNPLPPNYPNPAPLNDWGFAEEVKFYIVPEPGLLFSACELKIQWDENIFQFAGIDATEGLFSNNSFFSYNLLGANNSLIINGAINNNQNIIVQENDFIALLTLKIIRPGFSQINFSQIDFRKYDGSGGQTNLNVTGESGKLRSYLGDVATSANPVIEYKGDAKINFTDLLLWSESYWSGVTGYSMEKYKIKYDIGPTLDNTLSAFPIMDGKIQFEDLIIFSMSYGLSQNNVYPKTTNPSSKSVELFLDKSIQNGNEILIPLIISNNSGTLRGFELVFTGNFSKFKAIRKGYLMNAKNHDVLIFNKIIGDYLFVDFALLGTEIEGFCGSGEILLLVFEEDARIQLKNAEGRSLENETVVTVIKQFEPEKSLSYFLYQNFPNPFNSHTVIRYTLPKNLHVELTLTNSLGETVAIFVNEIKPMGDHSIEINLPHLSSGVYYYKLKTEEFNQVRKMVLLK
jgi:hypothetical protein